MECDWRVLVYLNSCFFGGGGGGGGGGVGGGSGAWPVRILVEFLHHVEMVVTTIPGENYGSIIPDSIFSNYSFFALISELKLPDKPLHL